MVSPVMEGVGVGQTPEGVLSLLGLSPEWYPLYTMGLDPCGAIELIRV